MPITYTEQDIRRWQSDLKDLPGKIEAKRGVIANLDEELGVEKGKRDELVTHRLNPVNNEIELLTAQINVLILPAEIQALTTKLAGQRADLTDHQRQLEETIAQLRPVDNEIQQTQLALELIACQARLSAVEATVAQHHAAYHSTQNPLSGLRSQSAGLGARIQAIKTELSGLQQPPIMPPPNTSGSSSYSSSQSQSHAASGYSSSNQAQGGYSSSQGSGYSSSNSNAITHLKAELALKQNEKNALDSNIASIVRQAERQRRSLRRAEQDRDALLRQVQSISFSLGTFSSFTSSYALQSRLSELERTRSPLVARKNQLDADVNTKKHQVRHTHSQLTDKENLLTLSERTAKNSTSKPLPALQQALGGQEDIQSKLLSEKAIYDRKIRQLTNKKRERKAELSNMTHRQTEVTSDKYLFTLTNKPDELYNQLVQRINEQIALYDKEHPANQSLAVRQALQDLHRQLLAIANGTTMPTTRFDTINCDRQRYYRLAGLMWKLRERTSSIDENYSFLCALDKMTGEKFVCEQEAKKEYDTLYATFEPTQMDITPDELLDEERTAYTSAANALKATLEPQPYYIEPEVKAVYWAARTVLKHCNAEVASATKKDNVAFDLKYHTAIIKKVTEVTQHPGDKRLVTECKDLCNHSTHGKSSLGKKIAGAMLTFLGAAAVAAGLYLSITSLGFAAPLSIGLLAGGGTLMASGIGLFCHGRIKGDERNLQAFNKAAGKVPSEVKEEDELYKLPTPNAPAFDS